MPDFDTSNPRSAWAVLGFRTDPPEGLHEDDDWLFDYCDAVAYSDRRDSLPLDEFEKQFAAVCVIRYLTERQLRDLVATGEDVFGPSNQPHAGVDQLGAIVNPVPEGDRNHA